MCRAIFSAVFLLLIGSKAIAGWYQVSNYVGNIGKYPIHISIQKYDSFGSGLTIKGSYYYDKIMTPIPLYGKYSGQDSVEICEIHNDDEFEKIIIKGSKSPINTKSCQFKLTLNESGAHGTWANGAASYEVSLHLIGAFSDTKTGFIKGTVEIPYWGQSQNHMFIGVYEDTGSGISINRIKVVNKIRKAVIQELNPQKHDCLFGFFMTPIYMNVESYKLKNYEQIVLNCYEPRNGGLAYYLFDKASNSFRFSEMK